MSQIPIVLNGEDQSVSCEKLCGPKKLLRLQQLETKAGIVFRDAFLSFVFFSWMMEDLIHLIAI